MVIRVYWNTLLWDLPGDVLTATASALCGWTGVVLFSLSLYWAPFLALLFLHLSGQDQSDNVPSHQPGWLE